MHIIFDSPNLNLIKTIAHVFDINKFLDKTQYDVLYLHICTFAVVLTQLSFSEQYRNLKVCLYLPSIGTCKCSVLFFTNGKPKNVAHNKF